MDEDETEVAEIKAAHFEESIMQLHLLVEAVEEEHLTIP